MSPEARCFLILFGTIVVSPATLTAEEATAPNTVEIFTTSDIAVELDGFEATVFEIDALAGLTEELSHGLPADPEAAKRMALSRISEIDDVWRAKAQQATDSLSRAHRYDLKKLPAIVFDHGRSVVYGTTDLSTAVDIYKRSNR